MAENQGNLNEGSEQRTDLNTPSEKTERGAKQQTGRSPARPPYEQYLRMIKVLK